MSVYEAVIALVGDPPPGYDILVWIFAAIVLIFLITSAFNVLYALLKFISDR